MTKPDAAHVPALPLNTQKEPPRFSFLVPLGVAENVNIGTREDGAVELRFRLRAPLMDIAIQLDEEAARTLGKALTAPSVVVAGPNGAR